MWKNNKEGKRIGKMEKENRNSRTMKTETQEDKKRIKRAERIEKNICERGKKQKEKNRTRGNRNIKGER